MFLSVPDGRHSLIHPTSGSTYHVFVMYASLWGSEAWDKVRKEKLLIQQSQGTGL